MYKDGKCIKEDRAINIEDLIEELNGNETVFVGDGVFQHRDLIISKMGNKAYFAPQSTMMAKASVVAQIALERALNNSFDDIYNLEPVYLRSSQAEREYNNRVKENLE